MHSCPVCGEACYCHGDVDDCEVETEEYASEMCEHCEGRDDGDVDFDDALDFLSGMVQGACRVCGCTDQHACAGGCYWVEPDLCSACAYRVEVGVNHG